MAINQFAGIAVTLALLAGMLWMLRKRGHAQWTGGRAARAMEVVESRSLGPGHTLHLVRVADRVLALATHAAGCTLLEARPWSELQQAVKPEVRP